MPTKAESIAAGKARKQKSQHPRKRRSTHLDHRKHGPKVSTSLVPIPPFTFMPVSPSPPFRKISRMFLPVEKHKDGIALKDLKVAKLGEKTLRWFVRQLAKHEFTRCKAEEKAEPKKAAKKEEK